MCRAGPLTPARLIALIEAAGYEPRPYSRGGMFDRECVGFADDGPLADDGFGMDVVDDILIEAADQAEYLALLHGVRTDGKGRGAVFYWPAVAWPGEGEGVAS